LKEALQHSELAVGDLIWVDAICINQNDLYEKSCQVNMMGLIYSNAKKVVVWLGAEERHTRHAVEFLGLLSAALRKSNYRRDPGIRDRDDDLRAPYEDKTTFLRLLRDAPQSSRVFQGLSGLLSRTYWERVWIIQEISKAGEAKIRCGELKIDLDAILCAGAHHTELSERNRSLLAAISQFRTQERGIPGASLRMPLINAMILSRFSLATDERDKVYAILGLTSDGNDLVPTLSYVDPVQDVFERLTAKIIQTQQPTHALSLARRAPLSFRFPDSPPWAIDWADLQYNIPPWLISEPGAMAKPALHSVDFENSKLYTRGRLVGRILYTERSEENHTSINVYDEDNSLLSMNDLCSDFLDLLSLRKVSVKEIERIDLTDAFSRMIKDAINGFPSAEYDFSRVNLVLSQVGDLVMGGKRVRRLAAIYNAERDAQRRKRKSATVPELQSRSYNPLRWGYEWLSRQEPRLKKSRIDDTNSVPSIVALPQSTDEPFKDAMVQNDSLKNPAFRPPLLAFKAWEDILDELNVFPQYQLHFAVTSTNKLILVPREAQRGDCIYQVDHCILPVVLRSNQHGDRDFIGEACFGRRQLVLNKGPLNSHGGECGLYSPTRSPVCSYLRLRSG
jgi:hypothetical protein